MKKVILFLLLLSILSPYVFANNYELYCSNNHPLKTFNGNIASLSGFNLLTRNIAENIIQKEIKKETDSKFSGSRTIETYTSDFASQAMARQPCFVT